MEFLGGKAFPRICLLAASVPLLAQDWTTFHSAYQDGLAAQARGDHALAVKAFARASHLQPTPGERVHTYGLNFLPAYHPYLHLAQSALALGDLASAESALLNPSSQALEPAAPREALLARIHSLRQAAAAQAAPARPSQDPGVARVSVEVTPPPLAPAPASTAPGAPVKTALPAVETAQVLPERARAAPPARPSPPPREPARAQAPQPSATASPAPAPSGSVPSQPPPFRPWAYLGGAALALAAAGGWLRARRKPGPAPSPGADRATGTPTAMAPSQDGDPNLGRRFGPWLATGVLGRGGCATAYRGVHADTGQEVAIKVPHPHLAEDPAFLARFRREAALGALLDHPRIVGILDPGPPEGQPWLAMPYVKGITLEAHLRRTGPLPIPQALGVAADVAEATAYAHTKGIVHRDLKPANVMLTAKGAVVMDLGIARHLEGGKVTSVYLGTPIYSAPESIADPSVGPAADRYALGIMLFEMLAGHPPFQGETPFQILEAHRFQPLPELAALRPQVPERLRALVRHLCAKTPEERPEDGEVMEILGELKKELPIN